MKIFNKFSFSKEDLNFRFNKLLFFKNYFGSFFVLFEKSKFDKMARRKGRRNGGKKVEQLRSRNFSIKRVVSKSESESKSAPILSMVSGKKIIAMQTSNDCIQQQENIFSTGKRVRISTGTFALSHMAIIESTCY